MFTVPYGNSDVVSQEESSPQKLWTSNPLAEKKKSEMFATVSMIGFLDPDARSHNRYLAISRAEQCSVIVK